MSRPETMRAAVQRGPRQVEVTDVARPTVEPGTAVVRVLAAGICGSDLHPYRHRAQRQERPDGHEVAGEVVALMPHPGERPRVREGDLVALDTICLGRACGDCEWCGQGAYFHCERKRRGDDWMGAFAQYIKRDVRSLFPLPAAVGPAQGAAVEPLAVGVHAMRLAGLQPGETVAIVGAGTIGITSLIAAVAGGAGAVYVLGRHPHQIALAHELGAAEAIAGPPQEATERVRDLTRGRGVDLAIETVGGTAPTVDQAVSLVRRRGRVAALGVWEAPVPVALGRALGREATLHFPVCYGEQDGRHDYEIAIDWIAAGKAPVDRLVTHHFPLERAADAFAIADDKSSGAVKVQLTME